jgi:hypothetical protein
VLIRAQDLSDKSAIMEYEHMNNCLKKPPEHPKAYSDPHKFIGYLYRLSGMRVHLNPRWLSRPMISKGLSRMISKPSEENSFYINL